jgi:hypothetical protein
MKILTGRGLVYFQGGKEGRQFSKGAAGKSAYIFTFQPFMAIFADRPSVFKENNRFLQFF